MPPSRLLDEISHSSDEHSIHSITKFTNCRLVQNGKLVPGDLWINRSNGRIVDAQKTFYADRTLPDRVIDLNGRILAPGFLDVQFNGAFTFDLSRPAADGDMSSFKKGLQAMNYGLIKTGVTSYLATMTSQSSRVYQKVRSFTISSATWLMRGQDSSISQAIENIEGTVLRSRVAWCTL